MKILITADTNMGNINGVVTSYMNLFESLRAKGEDVRILTLSPTRHSYKEGRIYYYGSLSANMIYPKMRVRLLWGNSVIKEIIEWKPDIIHSQCELSTFTFAIQLSKKLHIPLVHTYHTVYEDYTQYIPIPGTELKKKTIRLLSKGVLDLTDCVIVPSNKVKLLLEKYKVKKPIEIIPSGIRIEKHKAEPTKKWINDAKKRLEISNDYMVLIFVGRLAKEKNIEELIDYMKSIKDEKILLLLVGGGPYLNVLQAEGEKEKISNIRYTGMIMHNDVARYYHLGDVFVNASTSETQGLTYLEAISSGLPCVCRKDACLEGVINQGVNGFQYENEEEFKKYVLTLYNDKELRNKMKDEALKLSNQEFSIEKFGDSCLKLYEKLIEDKKNK